MKKVFSIIFATTIYLGASAQTESATESTTTTTTVSTSASPAAPHYSASAVYLQGGLNLANVSTTNDGQTEDNNMMPSFNVGVMVRPGISNVFDLEIGALLTGHGSRTQTNFFNSSNYVKSSFTAYYLQIPLNAVIKIPLDDNNGSNIFFNAGPYAAMGLWGHTNVQTNILNYNDSKNDDIQFNNDDITTQNQEDAAYNKLKRFDFGLNFGGGFDFGRVLVKANYGLGLTKIRSTEDDDNANDKNKYRTLSFSVGIKL
ncbi:MAG: PorT family protein [Sphingobacteriales bacterium]|nr:PorT family protein [Sphingobacteriales bacterium]